jgi:hypothetical protein
MGMIDIVIGGQMNEDGTPYVDTTDYSEQDALIADFEKRGMIHDIDFWKYLAAGWGVRLKKLEEAARPFLEDWPHYTDEETGSRYCYYCGRLLAGGPHSPSPHEPVCPIERLAALLEGPEAQSEGGVK